MVFSSVTFLCLFLPIFLAFYYLSRNITYRNFVLVAFSLIFYAWGEPVWVLALLASGLTDFICGLVINKCRTGKGKKIALAASLIINLGLLTTFKYSGFIIQNINALLHTRLAVPGFDLPLGISFYTFQTLSYTVDMYRGKIKVQKNLLNFLCYVTMFPQLIAGPIVRYGDIESGLSVRKISGERFSGGITRFACGLAKKAMLANPAGAAAALLLADTAKMTTASAWLGIVFFAFQMYFDFSGYSDMAIGLGKMLGFNFPENFNYPYEARSITDFWRRWHISLSSFFRDYVYIPLGGNRRFQIRNIAVVWILTGIWHGASWNFVLWGAYFGALLLFEKYTLNRALNKIPVLYTRVYTIIAILIGWGLFYFTDLSDFSVFFRALFFTAAPRSGFLPESALVSHIWLLIALAAASTSLPKKVYGYLFEAFPKMSFAEPVFAGICILSSFFMLLGQTYNPFLYFRF